ncbi:MAG TPA: hypothetical protein VKB96_03590, partial [Gammaproteobacteria bacterium]|nr:hypothetical protein [Gammaproteobacteria bacterium]
LTLGITEWLLYMPVWFLNPKLFDLALYAAIQFSIAYYANLVRRDTSGGQRGLLIHPIRRRILYAKHCFDIIKYRRANHTHPRRLKNR